MEAGVAGRRNADVRMVVVQLSRRRRRKEERRLLLLGVMLVRGCLCVVGVIVLYLVGGC